jgi:hypothetical protein
VPLSLTVSVCATAAPPPGPPVAGVCVSAGTDGRRAREQLTVIGIMPVIKDQITALRHIMPDHASDRDAVRLGPGASRSRAYQPESDASAWSPGLARGGAGPREVDARYLRGAWQVDQGHQLGRPGRCRAGLAGNAVRHLVAVCGYQVPADSAAAVSYGVMAAAGKWVLLRCPGVRSPWLDAVGGTEFCVLVCAGQAVLRTVSVAVRAMGRLGARVHGRIGTGSVPRMLTGGV